MKTVKIILAVLLLMSLTVVTSCIAGQVSDDSALIEELEALPLDYLTKGEIARLPRVIAEVEEASTSLVLLLICTFIFVLAAGIFAIAWRKKFYGALVSGILVLIPYVWNSSLQNTIKRLANDSILKKVESVTQYENTSTLVGANFMLFLPMAALLVIGIVEMIVHFVKRRKAIPLAEITSNNEGEVSLTKELSIDELKKFKELLDMGIITQEEFDAKKKQLLGL